MTEDEAKTKWCPETRYFNDGTKMWVNRTGVDWLDKCIGSACMAWRWKQRVTNQEEMDNNQYSTIRIKPILEDTDQGYCGLAGRPC